MEITDEIRAEILTICDLIADGQSVRAIMKDRKMFCRAEFYKMVDKDEELKDHYARAMSDRADHLFEEILTISDSQEYDVSTKEDGTEVINHNVINRNRLQVDSRKWILSKMNPKKYGDKVDVTTDGKAINILNLGSGAAPDEPIQ